MNEEKTKHKDILEGFEHLDQDTYGPNKYIVRELRDW